MNRPSSSSNRHLEEGFDETLVSESLRAELAATELGESLGREVATGDEAIADRRRVAEKEEERQTALRTRGMIASLLLMTPAFLAADMAVATYIEPCDWRPLISIRLVSQLFLLGIFLWLRSAETPSHRRLLGVERVTTSAFALMSSMLCIFAGGISSIYAIGVAIIVVGRSTMRTDRSHEAAPSLILAVSLHPALLLISGLFSTRIASQLSDPRQLAIFGVYVALNFIIMLIVLRGGDTIWKLRRQLFEARQIGRYQLQHVLGAGGMGEVWAAYFPPLRRNVAVKILKGIAQGAKVARFEREARATAELTHPNTIRVFDFGTTDDGLWYYAMELLEGENLGELVRREGALPPARARHMVLQASRALAEAHGRGIVHRDIKPENLFVTELGGESDFIKVLDFGIAAVQDDSSTVLTETGSVMGTPLYMPPEVASGQSATARSDVYALGAVLYFLLCGAPPFMGDSTMQLLSSIVRGDAPTPSERAGVTVPAQLESIVMRCLAVDPGERLADAGELADALARCPLDSSSVEPAH